MIIAYFLSPFLDLWRC